jgi:AraC-like DNA-binding protein
MVATLRRIEVERGRAETGTWELVRGAPDARLASHVVDYCGYLESVPAPLRRRELPVPVCVLIIDFGPTLRIIDPRRPDAVHAHGGGFVAGLGDVYTITENLGVSRGVQINVTPLGAYRLIGRPMAALTNEVVAIGDVLGVDGALLADQLQDLPTWEARFARLDRFVEARLARGPAIGGDVAWAYRRIADSAGAVAVGDLARELGISRKHLAARFHAQIGMAPKPLARLMRFDRVMQLLRSGRFDGWAEIAQACGYYDQPHFIREFRAFAGATPGEYLVRRLDMGGIRD